MATLVKMCVFYGQSVKSINSKMLKNLLKQPSLTKYAINSLRKSDISSSCNNRLCSPPKNYEGEGKTSLNILNDETELGLMINGYSQVGFRLNNELTVLGPMAIFPRSVLSWNVTNEINELPEEALSLFTVLEPKLDIIVLGIGDRSDDLSFYKRLIPFIRKHKLSVEVLPTEQACSTFNFLNSEGRYVAGALIPPQSIEVTDDDILATKLRYQRLYELD